MQCTSGKSTNVNSPSHDDLGSRVREVLRTVADFPRPGINFIDVMPIVSKHPKIFFDVTEKLASMIDSMNPRPTKIMAPEARGFLFASPVAIRLGIPLICVRKPGKLPGEIVSETYQLEYGHDTLCVQSGWVEPGDKIVIIDDLLATGGTVEAMFKLAKKLQAEVQASLFVVELTFLNGRNHLEQLGGVDTRSILVWE